MDTMLVVLRHALWSRYRGGLGWKHLVIPCRRGAWWNRFSWASEQIARWHDTAKIERVLVLRQEISKPWYQAARFGNRNWQEIWRRIAWSNSMQNKLRALVGNCESWKFNVTAGIENKAWTNQSIFAVVETSAKMPEKVLVPFCL